MQSDSGEDVKGGVYGVVKKLSDRYADRYAVSKKKVLSSCYEVLLKKTKTPKGLLQDWEDGDVLNATLLGIQARCLLKNNWTSEKCKKVLKDLDVLHKHKNSDYYKNSVAPTLKMLLSIHYGAKKIPLKEKEPDKFFNTDIISSYLTNLNNYKPKEEMEFFSFPKLHGLFCTQRDADPFLFKLDNQLLTFDYVFRRENYKRVGKSPNDLDEGFVTPNEDHLEKSPCFEIACLPAPREKKELPKEKFDWDFNVVTVPPSSHKCWETYNLIGYVCKEPPFIHKDIFLQQWLSIAPQGVMRLSPEQLLGDILSVLVGIPSSTFLLEGETFKVKENTYTDELTPVALVAFCQDVIEAGAAFKALTSLSENRLDEHVVTCAFKLALKDYLYKYQTAIILYYEKCKEKSYFKFVIDIKPFIDQVTYLKKVLTHDFSLKGVSFLKHLFELMGCAPNSSIFYILSSLFLTPCIHFFRIIDDWVFLGKWSKYLPLTPHSMELVNDRNSWLESHMPIHSQVPWFLPVKDLAHCGKAISLLSLSKKNEKFLSLLKSNNRPKVKLCFDLEEVDALKEECEKYYEEVSKTFCPTEEQVDLVKCALEASQMKTDAYERRKLEEKMKEIKKKTDELCLREEDLVRSAQNKALKRQEDEAEDARVIKEQEEILSREQEETLNRAKQMYEKYKSLLDEDEKRMRKHEWKIKRLALDEKRKEFLSNDEIKLGKELLLTCETNVEGTCRGKSNSDTCEGSNQINIEVSHELCDKGARCVQTAEISSDGNMLLNHEIQSNITHGDVNRNIDSSSLQNSVLMVNEQYSNTELKKDNDNNENSKTESVNDTNFNVNHDANGNPEIESIPEIDKKHVINQEIEMQTHFEISTGNTAVNVGSIPNEETLSELERNKLKVLGSDLGRGGGFKIHTWSEETERNKKNMMESHLQLDYNYEEKKINSFGIESFTGKVDRNEIKKEKMKTAIELSSPSPNSQLSSSNENEKNYLGSLNNEEHDLKKGKSKKESDYLDIPLNLKWSGDDSESNRMMKIFKSDTPQLIPNKDIDYVLLNKLVPNSLKIVLNIQVKLVNEALLHMFLSEFHLIKIAQKLREYFFLYDEFGKRLTSSLSKAVEVEEPSSLLTFYRLRDILVDACRGDIKEISFVVKETPAAFNHTNSQVLSCLGLTYKFEWPLNLIFTDMAISKYNHIFEYMFSLHRVAWHLEEVWLSLNFKYVLLKGKQYTQIQLYRHVMLQFVCTLRSHISTTVFESCWQDFIEDTRKVKDLDELYRRHAAYIMQIKSKCFLDEKSERVMVLIQKLLGHILVFCRVLRFGEWSVSDKEEYNHSNFKKLKSTFSSFLQHARTVTKFVEKLVKTYYQKEHEILYYFLSMNSFYIS